MENNGWIKLHRKSLESQIWTNANGWKIWCWILIKANHSDEPNWVGINTGRGNTSVRVYQGQFIYGRKTAAIELKMTESTVRNWIKKLSSPEFNMICVQAKSHFSIIQVNNWKEYQENKRTTKGQPKDTNKNYNNYKKTLSTLDSRPIGENQGFTKTDTISFAEAKDSISVQGACKIDINSIKIEDKPLMTLGKDFNFDFKVESDDTNLEYNFDN